MANKKSAAPKKVALKAPKKAWKVETHGSGPLGRSDDGAIYAPLRTKAGHRVAALDAATGATRWDVRGHANMVAAAPIVVTPEAIALRTHAMHGPKELQVHAPGDGVHLRAIPCAGSAALDESQAHVFGPFRLADTLVCVTLGPLAYALRQAGRQNESPPRARVTASGATSGEVRWSVELPIGVVLQHAFAEGDRLVVGGRQTATGSSDDTQPWVGRVFVFRGDDGSSLWEDASGASAEGGGEGVVLVDVRDARSNARDDAHGSYAPNVLVALDGATGAERFRRPMASGWASFVSGGRILVLEAGTDAAVCLDATTGAELWSAPSPDDERPNTSGSPTPRSFALCRGTVWFTGSRDRILGYHLDDGRLQRSNIRGFHLTSDEERLFVGDASSLTAYAFV